MEEEITHWSKTEELKRVILYDSVEKVDVDIAFAEWFLYRNYQGYTACLCGHPQIRNIFVIKNSITREQLYPIGSTCISKFADARMRLVMKKLTGGTKKYKKKGVNEAFDGMTFEYIYTKVPRYIQFLIENGLEKNKNNKAIVEYYYFMNYYHAHREDEGNWMNDMPEDLNDIRIIKHIGGYR
jgi:hypothetical protein